MNSADIHEILRLLPHRYPFLLVDRVLEFEAGKTLLAVKNVTINEPFFTGHFPGRPVFPGVMILEALAQATGLLTFRTVSGPPDHKSLYYFVGVDNARFKRPVEPGDQLMLRVNLLRQRARVWKFESHAMVDDKVVCEATLMCAAKEFADD